MNSQHQRRRTFGSERNNNAFGPSIISRLILTSFILIILIWIGTAALFLMRQGTPDATESSVTSPHDQEVLDLETNPMMALDVQVESQKTITIRIIVYPKECPEAYEFLTWITNNQDAECRPCTIYRGEPVPSYWGSPEYPDRWDNGGRWGPPYALVQGGFVNSKISHVEREANRPVPLERGMVAWAGPRGIHFFVALADHPEWGNEHTVWGKVVEEDMKLLDALVDGSRPLKVLEKNVPVVTNFVDPMKFRIREYL